LSKSIHDASWSNLIQFTKYKAEEAGKFVKLVNPCNTSQICSNCGQNVKKSLATRTHNCPHCGLIIDRDHNAAINILNRAVGTTV
ncbi:MAG: transposase, partial [Methanohalophilus sp.]